MTNPASGKSHAGAGSGEFDLIRRYLSGIGPTRPDVVLGPGDDAAVVRPPPDRSLVLTLDTLVAGRHFPEDLPAADLGRRLLAVNLSDLAAMGAEPAWAMLSVSLPGPDEVWLEGFARGLGDLAGRYEVSVVGGDFVRGPLAVSAQLCGFAGPGPLLRRSGAKVGDEIWVSGSLGGAMAALEMGLGRSREAEPELYARFASPEPRVALGVRLAGLATSAIDVSDGLAADLGHLLTASGLGGEVAAEHVPLHPASVRSLSPDRALELALTGGDDYELCFTLPPERGGDLLAAADGCGTPVSRIGRCRDKTGLAITLDGRPMSLARTGWDHFGASL